MAPTPMAPASLFRTTEGLGVWEHRGEVAVAGIGYSPTDRRWDERVETSVGAYALIAAQKALDDAGISADDVDGLVVVPQGTGDSWAPRPIPEDFAKAFQPTDNPEDGLTAMSVDWMVKNMGLKNLKVAFHAPVGCMSNAIVIAAQIVGEGLSKVCLVVRVLNNLSGRYQMSGPNALDTASGSLQWTNPWNWWAGIPQYAFLFDQYCRKYGSNHDKMAPFIVNQRRNGRMFPEGWYYQHPEAALTAEDYLASRWVCKPMNLHDCDRPIQVSCCYVYTTAERARDMKQPPVYILGVSSNRPKIRSSLQTLEECEASTDAIARKVYESSGLAPSDVDVFNPYDGYTLFTQYYLEALQWHGVKRGEAHDFYAGDISVEGPHPFSSSGGNNGNGRTRTWLHTDCIQQLRGQAGERQVRIRAETAVSGGMTPMDGDWTVWGKSPD
jgi:acetyl-CoA acetyltransferase